MTVVIRKTLSTTSQNFSRPAIVDLSLRDGIQGFRKVIPTDVKLRVAKILTEAGVQEIEFGAFVRKVPQMKDTPELAKRVHTLDCQKLWALVANRTGYMHAKDAGVRSISIAASVSDLFAKKNINRTVEETFSEFGEIIVDAQIQGISTRLYLSCASGCPFGETITPQKVRYVTCRFWEMGVDEIVLSDTTGMGTVYKVEETTRAVLDSGVNSEDIAWHFHGKHPEVESLVETAVQNKIVRFDSSVGNLGGCPFAPAHYGNVSTGHLVNLLETLGISTGINTEYLLRAQRVIEAALGEGE